MLNYVFAVLCMVCVIIWLERGKLSLVLLFALLCILNVFYVADDVMLLLGQI